jgi:hypothetical protein
MNGRVNREVINDTAKLVMHRLIARPTRECEGIFYSTFRVMVFGSAPDAGR